MADAETELSVVIVNWNARAELLACLESLARHPPSCDWEAIVVDNASSDGSADAVRSEQSWATVLAQSENLGLAAGNNAGLRVARGSAVLISNPDVVFTPGAIDAMRAALDRHPRACFVIPRLVHSDGTLQTSAGDLPSLREALFGRRAQHRRQRGRTDHGYWWDNWAHDRERQVGHGAESCYLVRTAAVADFGPQDGRFRLDWEGIEWSARATDAGWEVWFCPDAEVVHLGGVSVRQAPMRWIIWSHLGMYSYFRPRLPTAARPLLAAAVLARAVAKIAVASTGARLYDWAHRARGGPGCV